MTSTVVLVLDVLIVALIVTIVNIAVLDAPIWLIAIPLIPIGIIFGIWLIRKLRDRDD